ncbi:histidinol-phosphatase [Leifsonia sp. Root112D2]|uniref:histidinol-phosphatase n=1 Tax=Leifsonia sp. Root112D2 TaxID=1736426 RepID=UPI0006F66F4D|nr:histidinol-phosphatase [Leifsonia sp. Root112D2]KQV08499.1 histidinol phosphatase [Leifsonia sp. Root112D2]
MTDASGPSLDDDLALALRLADAADAISADRFRSRDLTISTKPDRTYVTDADQAVERAIRAGVADARPGDGIYGEEYGTEGDSSRQWIIDPIDGTANYLRGVPVWGTLIALAIDGVPLVGVVSSPALGKRWWAAKGSGAWLQEGDDAPRRIRVSGVSELTDASISFQSIAQWDDAGYLERLIALSRTVWRDRAYGDMWAYMMLAEGLLDAVGEFDVQAYDLAALIPIVEEAGGRFTSVTGEQGPGNGSSLATNGVLHDALLDALR